MRVGTDDLPLLVNLCSIECEDNLPEPKKGYVGKPHKGGLNLRQPTYEEWEKENVDIMTFEEWNEKKKAKNKSNENEPIKFLTLIRKIWKK